MASITSTSFNSLSSTATNHLNRTTHSPAAASTVSFRRPFPTITAVYSTATASVGVASTTTLQPSSFYEVLGIQAGASGKEIKAAYRKLARVLHPDVALVASNGGVKDLASSSSSADEFIKVHEAYATLSDPKKRADYDRMMWLQGRRLSYSPTYCTMGTTKYGGATTSCSGFSGYTRRTWETDQCW